MSFEIARRHHFQEELANLPEGIELHILPSGSTAPSLKVRYRSTSGIAERIDAAYRAGSTYLDRVLS